MQDLTHYLCPDSAVFRFNSVLFLCQCSWKWGMLLRRNLWKVQALLGKVKVLERVKRWEVQGVSELLEQFQSAITPFKTHAEVSFPHGKTAGVQVLCACAIPLPSSLSVCDVTKRKWRLRSRRRFVCCNLWSTNQLFLFSGHSGDNSTVIPHLPIPLTLRRLMSYIYIWSTHSWCF